MTAPDRFFFVFWIPILFSLFLSSQVSTGMEGGRISFFYKDFFVGYSGVVADSLSSGHGVFGSHSVGKVCFAHICHVWVRMFDFRVEGCPEEIK